MNSVADHGENIHVSVTRQFTGERDGLMAEVLCSVQAGDHRFESPLSHVSFRITFISYRNSKILKDLGSTNTKIILYCVACIITRFKRIRRAMENSRRASLPN